MHTASLLWGTYGFAIIYFSFLYSISSDPTLYLLHHIFKGYSVFFTFSKLFTSIIKIVTCKTYADLKHHALAKNMLLSLLTPARKS